MGQAVKTPDSLILATAIWEARRLLAASTRPLSEDALVLRNELMRTLSAPELCEVLDDLVAGDERDPCLNEPLSTETKPANDQTN